MVNRLIKLPKSGSFFIFGARGTGKTTLLKSKYPEALYFNLLLNQVSQDRAEVDGGRQHVVQ